MGPVRRFQEGDILRREGEVHRPDGRIEMRETSIPVFPSVVYFISWRFDRLDQIRFHLNQQLIEAKIQLFPDNNVLHRPKPCTKKVFSRLWRYLCNSLNIIIFALK